MCPILVNTHVGLYSNSVVHLAQCILQVGILAPTMTNRSVSIPVAVASRRTVSGTLEGPRAQRVPGEWECFFWRAGKARLATRSLCLTAVVFCSVGGYSYDAYGNQVEPAETATEATRAKGADKLAWKQGYSDYSET